MRQVTNLNSTTKHIEQLKEDQQYSLKLKGGSNRHFCVFFPGKELPLYVSLGYEPPKSKITVYTSDSFDMPSRAQNDHAYSRPR